MKKILLTLVVTMLAIDVNFAIAADKKADSIIKRKPRGNPNSTARGKKNQTQAAAAKEEVQTDQAPPEKAVDEPKTEIKKSGMALTDGESRDDLRARQALAKGKSGGSKKSSTSSDMDYDVHFSAGCYQVGVGSGVEGSTRHMDCESSLRVDLSKKEWPVTPYIQVTGQKDPYEGFAYYKDEINNKATRIHGDASLGLRYNLGFWKSKVEGSLGLESANWKKGWHGIYRARLLSQPKEGWFSELSGLTNGKERSEGKLVVLTNKLADDLYVGGYGGWRLYNWSARQDRVGPVVRYQFDGWALEASGEYAFAFGWGGGLKIEIPRFW